MIKNTIMTGLAAFVLVLSAAVPGLAHEGHRGPHLHAQGQERAQAARQSAEERVEQIKTRVEERRAKIREEVCERRQERLQTVIPRLATSATALKTATDTVYERVQGFYEDKQLTVDNYDELKANVDAAQADAAAAIAAVEEYEFVLDCDNPNVAEQLDGFRQAVGQARDALKAYRAALVELISAMRAEAFGNAENGNSRSDTDNEEANDEE